MSYFSNRFKNLREEAGLTQQEMADALGMSRSSVGMYENGKREPDFETLEIIADYFNVNMGTLIADPGKMKDTDDDHAGLQMYYLDPETARLAQELHDDEELHLLFDAAKDITPEQLKAVRALIRGFKETAR